MTLDNSVRQARGELDRINQHINNCCSCTTCEAHYPVNTLHAVLDVLGEADKHSPLRYKLMTVITTGLNIDSDDPIPPGVMLQELMKAVRMTEKRLADLTGRSVKNISDIRNGRAWVTHEMALLLEQAGLSNAATWNRVTAEYKTWQLRQEDKK